MDISSGETGMREWNPRSREVLRDQVGAYDALRERCPVAHSDTLGWSLLRHSDVLAALADPGTYSSRVSRHVAVPNGMDPPEHTEFRQVVDDCFTPELVEAFAPELRALTDTLVGRAVAGVGEVEIMSALALPFAAQAQCAYLGWPSDVADALQGWAAASAWATAAGQRDELNRVAAQFDRIISEVLDHQRTATPSSVMARLLAARVHGHPLADAQMVSMLRNWTAGELGTIAAAVGIIIEHLARRQDLQELLRRQPEVRQAAMDEMLRLEAPLIANRRRTARSVSVDGRVIPADQPVTILWSAAQRDPRRFEDPADFRLDRDPGDNLLYGRGPHYCPGEGLSRLELGTLMDEFLRAVPRFRSAAGTAAPRAQYPSGGFSEVRISLV